MVFLGIDPGYGRLGYGLIEVKSNTLRQLSAGVIETPAESTVGERLIEIEEKLNAVVAPFEVDHCALENVFIKKNLTTGIELIQARGVILLTLTKQNIHVNSVSPTQIKKLITGSGTSNKKQIQLMIKKLLNLRELPKPDDAADGLGLALCAWMQHRNTRIKSKVVQS